MAAARNFFSASRRSPIDLLRSAIEVGVTSLPPIYTAPAALIGVLQATAMPAGGAVPNYDYGYGIIRPVAAARSLGIIP